MRAFQRTRGDAQPIRRVCSDNHRCIRKACQLLRITQEASQPSVRQANPRMEPRNRGILEGARAPLV